MICFIRGCQATEEALKADVKEQQRLKNVALDSNVALQDAVKVARNEADSTRAEHLAYRAFAEAELAKSDEETNKIVNDNMVFQLSRTGYDAEIKESQRRLAIASETIDTRNERIERLRSQIAYLESLIKPEDLADMPESFKEPVVSAYDAVPSESPLYVTEVENVTPESPLVVDTKPKDQVDGQTSIDADCFQDDDGNLICSK